MKSLRCTALAAACALVAFGCGDKKVEPVARVKVSGAVKVDGKPVLTGTITFDPQNGQPPGDASILDGKYEGLAPVGKCKVSINAVEKMTMKEWQKRNGQPVMDGPGYDEVQELNLLPPRYNSKSDIIREVTEPGPHTFDFVDMKSR